MRHGMPSIAVHRVCAIETNICNNKTGKGLKDAGRDEPNILCSPPSETKDTVSKHIF